MVSILNKQIYVATQLFTRYLNIHLFTRWHVANKKTIVSKVKIHKFTTSKKPKPNNMYVVVTIPSVMLQKKHWVVLCCVCAGLALQLDSLIICILDYKFLCFGRFQLLLSSMSLIVRCCRLLSSAREFLFSYRLFSIIPGRSYVHTNNKFNDFETKNGESSSSTL